MPLRHRWRSLDPAPVLLDDWEFLLYRPGLTPDSILEPHGEHISIAPDRRSATADRRVDGAERLLRSPL